jgi:flagellar biosynthesis/type III secretory pathway ATPase
LPRLLERTGQGQTGSITAVYTVLVEGGDMDEPIADEVRGILDGHVVLDRRLAERGRFPAVDVPASLSRLMPSLVTKDHLRMAQKVRQLVSTYEQKRDLVVLGAYTKGSDKALDEALAKMPGLEKVLGQAPHEVTTLAATLDKLDDLFE